MSKNWIKKATKHKGKLRSYAKRHKAIKKNGDIDLNKAMRIAKKNNDKKRIKEIELARTLKRMRKD